MNSTEFERILNAPGKTDFVKLVEFSRAPAAAGLLEVFGECKKARSVLFKGLKGLFQESHHNFDPTTWIEDEDNDFAAATRIVSLFNCVTAIKRQLKDQETRGSIVKKARLMCEQSSTTPGCGFKIPLRLQFVMKKIEAADPSHSIHEVSVPDDLGVEQDIDADSGEAPKPK